MICLDTAPIIWGVQGVARAGQEPMIDRTTRYLKHLEAAHESIMIPTPALLEYLIDFSPAEQTRQRQVFEHRFALPALDLPSAHLASQLLCNQEHIKKLRQESGLGRQHIRVDAMILAIAVVHGAYRLVTDDTKHFRGMAKGLSIEIIEVPDIPEQPQMFDV